MNVTAHLKPHPKNPKILLGISFYRYVTIWDLNTGEKIFEDLKKVKFKLRTEPKIIILFVFRILFKSLVSLIDSCWSPSHGERFATIDFVGRMSIYEFGEIPDEDHSQKTQINDRKYLIEPLANQSIEYVRIKF